MTESLMLKEEQMALAAAAPSAAGGDAQASGVASPSLPAAPEPAPVDPAPPTPRRPMTDIERMAWANDPARVPIPQSYLKGPPEPWRAFSHWFV
jgi:hypothetical protein